MRIEKLQKHFQIDVNLVHFPLHPETPKEGIPIKELYAGRNLDPEEMHKNMKIRMDAEGLPYGKRTHTYNSRNAQELGKWADTQSNGEAYHDALYRAYFVDVRNISEIDVLVEIAQSVGLEGGAALESIQRHDFKDEVDKDWAKSRKYGFNGVPTFLAGGFSAAGAQPYETLEYLVKKAGGIPK